MAEDDNGEATPDEYHEKSDSPAPVAQMNATESLARFHKKEFDETLCKLDAKICSSNTQICLNFPASKRRAPQEQFQIANSETRSHVDVVYDLQFAPSNLIRFNVRLLTRMRNGPFIDLSPFEITHTKEFRGIIVWIQILSSREFPNPLCPDTRTVIHGPSETCTVRTPSFKIGCVPRYII